MMSRVELITKSKEMKMAVHTQAPLLLSARIRDQGMFRGTFAFLVLCHRARRQRLALARMGARELDDIGITREQARVEAGRPIWDVPSNWLR